MGKLYDSFMSTLLSHRTLGTQRYVGRSTHVKQTGSYNSTVEDYKKYTEGYIAMTAMPIDRHVSVFPFEVTIAKDPCQYSTPPYDSCPSWYSEQHWCITNSWPAVDSQSMYRYVALDKNMF